MYFQTYYYRNTSQSFTEKMQQSLILPICPGVSDLRHRFTHIQLFPYKNRYCISVYNTNESYLLNNDFFISVSYRLIFDC